ncbi:cellulase family glycosylhydrolase [Mycolicibacterium sp. S2-37]|uniref:endo-1,4-beta-xylanase n=1 Tax=Mycolicibacterium sp. S2-37 TaxID=2810297 RepID=UPI001A945B04|nr:endo-1,4-beta-xylanase [Mycolicibacterium sp. S2-37]MBO0678707.1 cellulase family glycosylhydrolase [Mycolicibacterium sp. S2-37]
MRRRAALKVPLLLTAAGAVSQTPRAAAHPGRWSAARARDWHREQGWLVGANFITSNAVNQLEMFQRDTHDPERIDRELGLAREIGLNTVRVFLHDQLWTQDKLGFSRRLEDFVATAAQHEIKPLFVLLDSCWDPVPRPGRQRAPSPGVHNSRWVQSPGTENLQDSKFHRILYDYVTGVVGRFRDDERVLGWDVWNEPDNPAREYRRLQRRNKQQLVTAMLPHVFEWARSVDPVQPLTSGVWQGPWKDPARRSRISDIQLTHSDVISFHNYGDAREFEGRIDELASLERPMLCTEYLARTMGSTVEEVLPVARRRGVGAYSWGLVAGKTQTYLPWDSWDRPYDATPRVWFHDLLHADGRPYRTSEVDVIRQLSGVPRPS